MGLTVQMQTFPHIVELQPKMTMNLIGAVYHKSTQNSPTVKDVIAACKHFPSLL